MDKLCIPVSQAPCGGVTIHVVASPDELRPKGARELDLGAVTVSGALQRSSSEDTVHEYLFQGRISGVFRHACDRCLDMTDKPFDVEVVRVFVQGPARALSEVLGDCEEGENDYDAGFVAFQGDEIDLRLAVWEEIVLAAPTKFLCKQDCAGLCPVCGANRNRAACACEQTKTGTMGNTGLAGLADFLPDLRPDHPED